MDEWINEEEEETESEEGDRTIMRESLVDEENR